MSDGEHLPLSGIRVLDFSRLLPGPWCTQFLGDLGADVVKIEDNRGGDPSRHNPPMVDTGSVYFNSVNGQKRSVALDLRANGAAAVLERLFSWADIVVESFSVGTASRLGVGYDDARKVRPDIIYCSVSGYGQDGPKADVAGHDLVIQASAGLLDPIPDGLPHFQAADYSAASMAVIAVLAALRRRDLTGEGAYLDIAMSDSLAAMSAIVLAPGLARASGATGSPRIEVWGRNPRYNIYPTKDGRTVALCLLETRLWDRFCSAIGRTDLAAGEELSHQRHSDHGEFGPAYRRALEDYCGTRTLAEIISDMEKHDLPVVPVSTVDEAVADPHLRARGIIRERRDEDDRTVVEIGNPLARAGLARRERRPAPKRGADGQSVLTELGFGEEQMAALHAAGVI